MVVVSVDTDVKGTIAQSNAWVTQGDRSLIYRVVGFLEYSSALRNFDELVSKATQAELAAIDQLVQERPEFTVNINLALRLANRPTTLLPVGGSAGNTRRGLAWVMALARVELGAILATFDAHPNPFAIVRPSEFEWEAYRDIVLDDAEAHYWGLSLDPDLQRVADLRPGREILAYIRRITVAIALLHEAARTRADQLTNDQYAELVQQDKQLSQARGLFRLKVSAFLAANNRQFNANEKECCRLLEGDKKELSKPSSSGDK